MCESSLTFEIRFTDGSSAMAYSPTEVYMTLERYGIDEDIAEYAADWCEDAALIEGILEEENFRITVNLSF